MKFPIFFSYILLLSFAFSFSCHCTSRHSDGNRSYLSSRYSLNLEKENIVQFFAMHHFDIAVENTRNIENSRIFLHDFTALKSQILEMIQILKLDSVSQKDFDEVHSGELSYTPYKIHSPIGMNYLKDKSVWFYKSEEENKVAQKEIKATKVYLYYNVLTGKACFQTFYGWG